MRSALLIKEQNIISCQCCHYSIQNVWLLPVFFDASQQGLQPANGTLAVSIQKSDDLSCGGSGPPQPGSDQP